MGARFRDRGRRAPSDGSQPGAAGRDRAAHRGSGGRNDSGRGPAHGQPATQTGRVVRVRGDLLAEVVPRSGHGEDRPALELAVAEARGALELAAAERSRVDRLVDAGALPARRRLETRLAEQIAQAQVTAADAHLAQLDSTRRGAGGGRW